MMKRKKQKKTHFFFTAVYFEIAFFSLLVLLYTHLRKIRVFLARSSVSNSTAALRCIGRIRKYTKKDDVCSNYSKTLCCPKLR